MKSFIDSAKVKESTTKSIRIIGQEEKSQPYCKNNRNNKQKLANQMQNRSKMINKLALVLLSIVVLELVLIGDQVQPVKAIKKKIFLKKLKKLLPLMALVKPKKKIILVPIPIPMFKNPGHPHQQHHHHMGGGGHHHMHQEGRPQALPSSPPMSFMMMSQEPANIDTNSFMGLPMEGSMLPMSMMPSAGGSDVMSLMNSQNTNTSPNLQPTSAPPPTPAPVTTPTTSSTTSQPNYSASSRESARGTSPALSNNGNSASMMLPSMTMTIQSEPNGNSAIELSTNPNTANSTLGALIQRPQPTRWSAQLQQQQQQQQQQFDAGFDEPADQQWANGEPYYNSPWSSSRVVGPTSPAKLLHQATRPDSGGPTQSTVQIISGTPVSSGWQATTVKLNKSPPQHQQQAQYQMPVLLIKNQWRPAQQRALREPTSGQRVQLHQQQQLAVNKALEHEELMAVGPPQMMPVYQTSNGQLHMSPPRTSDRLREQQVGEQEDSQQRDQANIRGTTSSADLNNEVQTISPQSNNFPTPATPTRAANTATEPATPTTTQYSIKQQQKKTSQRLSSPVVKGKLQQQQQQQQHRHTKSPVQSGY